MREGGQEAPRTARWLAWCAVALLGFGVLSVGVVNLRDDGSGTGVVAAAGRSQVTVDVPPTSTTSLPVRTVPTSTPPSTVARSTTVPKAAAAVLAAIASTAPPTTQAPPATTTTPTTRPPVTTTPTTTAPTTTSSSSTSTTSTTIARQAAVTVVNEHPNQVILTVNGRVFDLDPAEQFGPFELVLAANGNDIIEVHLAVDAQCGVGDAGGFFVPGGRYKLAVSATPGAATCANNIPAPQFKVTTAP